MNRVILRRRVYVCPVCGNQTFSGYSCRPKPYQVTTDHYLLPRLRNEVHLQLNDDAVSYRDMSRFNYFLCSSCGFVIDGMVVLADRKVRADRRLLDFHFQVKDDGDDWLDLFRLFFLSRSGSLELTDWYELAMSHSLFSRRGHDLFGNRAGAFNDLVLVLLNEKNPSKARLMNSLLNQSINAGIADLLTLDSYENHQVMSTLYLYRMVQYAMVLSRYNDLRVLADAEALDPGWVNNLVERLLGVMFPDLHYLGPLMLSALKFIVHSQDEGEKNAGRRCALYATELLIRTGDLDYSNEEIRPQIVHQNNEAINYLNLLLRKELGDQIDLELTNFRQVFHQMINGLNKCACASRSSKFPHFRRAWKMGERITELSTELMPKEMEKYAPYFQPPR